MPRGGGSWPSSRAGGGAAGPAGGGACRSRGDGPGAERAPRGGAARGGDPVQRARRAAPQHSGSAGRPRPARRPGRRPRRAHRPVALSRDAPGASLRRLHGVLAGPVRRRRPRDPRRPRLHGRRRRCGGRAIRAHGPERSGVETARSMDGRDGWRAPPRRLGRRPAPRRRGVPSDRRAWRFWGEWPWRSGGRSTSSCRRANSPARARGGDARGAPDGPTRPRVARSRRATPRSRRRRPRRRAVDGGCGSCWRRRS